MKVPEEPPNFRDIVSSDSDAFFKGIERHDVQKLLRKMISQYPYWDKLKYWPMPDGITPQLAWTFREWTSIGKRNYIPLLDTSGKPFSYWLPDPAQERLYRIDRPIQLI